MRLSEAINEAVELAQSIRDYWDTELPKRHPDYPIVHPGEDSGPPPPQQAKLERFLTALPPEMIYKLMLIMQLGRGDFDIGELAEEFERIKKAFGEPEWVVAEMTGKAALADYLIDGIAKLRKGRVDVDKLPPKAAKPRK
jgi:hypothetical protein